MGPARPQRAGRRLGLALALALLLHGSVALWLLSEHAKRHEPQRIQVTLLEKPRLEVKPVTPIEPLIPPKPPPTVERRKTNVHKSPHAQPPQEPPALAGPPPSVEPPSAPLTPRPPPPAGGEDGSTTPGPVRLFDHDALANRLGKPGPFSPNHSMGGDDLEDNDNSAAGEKRRVTRRIESDLTEQQSTDRVEMGLVDPYFRQLARGADTQWKLMPATAGGSENSNQLKDLQDLVTRWFAMGKNYGRTGSPHPDDGTVHRPDITHPAGRDPNALDLAEYGRHWDTAGGLYIGGLLVLELTQDHDGTPLKVRLLRSSGNEALDASARSAIALAAKERIAPNHGLGLGGDYIFSLWKMEARVVPWGCSFIPGKPAASNDDRFNPTPIECGNNMDAGADGVKLHGPWANVAGVPITGTNKEPQNRVITRVDLIAVYGGETTAEAPAPPKVK